MISHTQFLDTFNAEISRSSLSFQNGPTAAVQAAAAVAAVHSPPLQPALGPARGTGVASYEHLYLAAGGDAAAGQAVNFKARRPVELPSPGLPEIQVQNTHHVPEVQHVHHVPEVLPAVRVPARVPVTAFPPENEADFELFNSLNPHRARKPALGKCRY